VKRLEMCREYVKRWKMCSESDYAECSGCATSIFIEMWREPVELCI
jgi:hypothetical protein